MTSECSYTSDLSTDQKLDLILKRTDKLDKLCETVEAFGNRIAALETTTQTLSTGLADETSQRNVLAGDVDVLKRDTYNAHQSLTFLSAKYDELLLQDEQKKKITTDIALLQAENLNLKKCIDNLKNNLEQSNSARNIDSQYHRTSLNIKLCGLPTQPGEEESTDGPSNSTTKELIELLCKTAGITMKKDAIDVCHRLGRDGNGPIIIRFATKSARFDFVRQGNARLKNLTTADIDFTKMKKRNVPPQATPAVTRHRASTTEVTNNAAEYDVIDPAPIYLQEHLTKYNKDLLTETRRILKDTHDYPGYVKDGQIRVKVNAGDRFSVIATTTDLKKEHERIMDLLQQQDGRVRSVDES